MSLFIALSRRMLRGVHNFTLDSYLCVVFFVCAVWLLLSRVFLFSAATYQFACVIACARLGREFWVILLFFSNAKYNAEKQAQTKWDREWALSEHTLGVCREWQTIIGSYIATATTSESVVDVHPIARCLSLSMEARSMSLSLSLTPDNVMRM